MKNKIIIIILLIIIAIVGILLFSHTAKSHNEPQQTKNVATSTARTGADAATSTPIHFEVVTTQAAQERGLGGRASIPDNYAMLFVFPRDDEYGFWMKDMLTSIDMIWLSDDGTIVSINKSVPANSYPEVFYPTSPIRYVLETKAGFADEKGWTIGTTVALPSPY